jgi:hypothetical protein
MKQGCPGGGEFAPLWIAAISAHCFIPVSLGVLKRRKAWLLRDAGAEAGAEGSCRRFAHEAGEMNCLAPLLKARFKITADSFIYSAQCLLLRNQWFPVFSGNKISY